MIKIIKEDITDNKLYSSTDWKDVYVVVDLERTVLEGAFYNRSEAYRTVLQLEKETGRHHGVVRTRLFR